MADAARAWRGDMLRSAGASEAVLDELLAYGVSLAEATGRVGAAIPAGHEPHLEVWREYAAEAATAGALPALRSRFVQLHISQTPEYRAATRQGRFDALTARGSLALEDPDQVTLEIVPTPAGDVPVLTAATRGDFEVLVQALTARNEPEPVPASLGACMISGLVNWDRVRRHRAAWERAAGVTDEAAWADEFRRLAADKPRYQDRLILLSRGAYSAVQPDGLDAAAWLAQSAVIRREHECVHYVTWRVFGVIRTHIFDELLADFVGLLRARGRYDAALARQCLGLDLSGRRLGGRFDHYRGTPPVSLEAFDVLAVLAARATVRLEEAWEAHGRSHTSGDALADWVWRLCHLPLEALASGDLAARLDAVGRPS
jgi:hypothetical protein